jgi:phosphoglycolate phosphatase-like HAD superfamily hydrolase
MKLTVPITDRADPAMYRPTEIPGFPGSPEPVGVLPDLVIFDLMGVLLRERPRLAACLSASLAAADLPVEAGELAELVMQPTRPGLTRLVSRRLRLSPEIARPLVGAVADDFRERVMEGFVRGEAIRTAPGVSTLLAELTADGVHVGIDSELDGELAIALIRRAGWTGTGMIEAVVGSDEVSVPRPGPGQIEEIRRRCGWGEAARVVKVAGSAEDARAGQAAGCLWVCSVGPERMVGVETVGDLGELTERLLARVLV